MKRMILCVLFVSANLATGLLYATTVVPSDSAALGAIPKIGQVVPALNSAYANVTVPNTGWGVGINTITCGNGQDNSYNIVPTATGTGASVAGSASVPAAPSPPYQMTGIDSNTTALPALPYSGHYLITYQGTVQSVQSSGPPGYFWIDDWATLPSGPVRLLFTGDMPDLAPPGGTIPVYLYTIVYLPATTVISFPRIWTVLDSTNTAPQLCLQGPSPSNGGTPSLFSVSLLNVSY